MGGREKPSAGFDLKTVQGNMFQVGCVRGLVVGVPLAAHEYSYRHGTA